MFKYIPILAKIVGCFHIIFYLLQNDHVHIDTTQAFKVSNDVPFAAVAVVAFIVIFNYDCIDYRYLQYIYIYIIYMYIYM